MSTSAMQAAGQPTHMPASVYSNPSSSRHYLQDEEGYYLSQDAPGEDDYQTSRSSRRTQGHHAAPSQAVYDMVDDEGNYVRGIPMAYEATTLPVHTRSQAGTSDQYDGSPSVPARTTSHQQSPNPPQSTRTGRHQAEASPRGAVSATHAGGNYNSASRDRPRDDASTAAPNSARSRRKGPPSPDAPHRATSARERGQQAGMSTQSRSDANMLPTSVPGPLVRENSEVINRLVVSDPTVDEGRMRERIAEAQPMAISGSTSGLGLVPGEGVDDGGRGPQRRQDYSKSRRKEIQFGEYVLGQTLGEGEFGKVKLGWKKDGSSQVAIKLIRRESVATNPTRLPKIYREINILQDLAHPNIVRLHEMVETERHIGIILEYASGGELFDYILNQRYLKDPAARRLFAQLVSGVGYLHKKGIVHRDLKLENLLLDQNKNIIITDFGFANRFSPVDELSPEIEYNLGNKDFVRKYKLDRIDANGMRKGDLMQTSCGSPCYAAPELVVSDSLYTGRKVDVWSCGVILYAMLAGYLPFDDDPANPEGDNINLLYKYITTTPLTFPEYVSPHARDLLRRILVPDPRKRADLFEVARHSWLTEYHHVVAHITSSTTNIADIANSTVTTAAEDEGSLLSRSTSVREQSTSPRPGTQPTPVETRTEDEAQVNKRERTTRHTLQAEYVAPKTHTARAAGPETTIRKGTEGQAVSSLPASSTTKPLPQYPHNAGDAAYTRPSPQQPVPAPVRPGRDVPRSASDMAGTLATSASSNMPQAHSHSARPSTQGSMTSAAAGGLARSDPRLPSRGSYGQPVAPSVATATAQGKVTQPIKAQRAYNIAGAQQQQQSQQQQQQQQQQQPQEQYEPMGEPTTVSMPPPPHQPQPKSQHRRSSTLSSLSEKLFGRSNSVAKREREEARQKNGKKYPPTAMKNPYPDELQPRMSTDSKRSFSFGLRKKESTEVEPQDETSSRRFSLLPNSMSFKGLGSRSRDQLPQAPRVHSPNQQTGRPGVASQSAPVIASDGQQDRRYNNFSRPPQAQGYGHRVQHSTNDVYGGTAVYNPDQTRPVQHRRAESHQPLQQYSSSFVDEPRPSASQNRNVLGKSNRKFNDAYENDHGRGGGSGAVKRVQDFFRRRGRARADGDYR